MTTDEKFDIILKELGSIKSTINGLDTKVTSLDTKIAKLEIEFIDFKNQTD